MPSCSICGKRGIAGYNVSHSNRHTNRRFVPNVHKLTLRLNSEKKKVHICTRCLRSFSKPPRR